MNNSKGKSATEVRLFVESQKDDYKINMEKLYLLLQNPYSLFPQNHSSLFLIFQFSNLRNLINFQNNNEIFNSYSLIL